MKKFISTIIAASILSASIITPVQAASFGRSSSPSPSRPTNTTKPTATPTTQPHQSNFSQNQSWGMQRPQVTQQVQSNQAPKPVTPTIQPTQSIVSPKPQQGGMNPVTAGVLGAGTGLLLGTAVGSAMASPTSPQTQQPTIPQPVQTVTVPNPYSAGTPTLPVQTPITPNVQQTPSYQPIIAAPHQPTTINTGWASFWNGIFGLIWFVIILALAVIGWIFYRNRSKVKSVKDAKDIMVHEFNQADLSKPAWKPESKLSVLHSPTEPKMFDAGVNRTAYSEKKKAHDEAMDIFVKIQTAFNQCDRRTLEQYVAPEGHHLFESMMVAEFNPSVKMPHINITCDIQDDGSESGIISAWFTAFDADTGIPVNEIWNIKDGKLMGVTQN